MKFLKASTWIAWGIAILAMILYELPIPVSFKQMFDPPLNSIILRTVFFFLPLAVLLLGIRIAVSMNVFPRILYIIGSLMVAVFMWMTNLELCMYDVSPWPNEYSPSILISWLSVAFGLILIALLFKVIQVIRDR